MPEDRAQQDSTQQTAGRSGASAGVPASRPLRDASARSIHSAIGNRQSAIENASPAVAPFIEQIKQDAQAEIGRIRGRADLAAKRKTEEAQREAESAMRQATQSAEDQARRLEARTMASVSLETRRTMLRVEGEIVNEVLDRARKRLTDFRETAEYAGFLTRLSVEGILALEDNKCVLAPAAADAKLFTPQKVAEITSIAERLTGREIKLSLANDASLDGFGVRVYAGSKRALFDNTLAARLERLADELRMIVVKEVFAPAPPDASSGRGSGAGGQE